MIFPAPAALAAAAMMMVSGTAAATSDTVVLALSWQPQFCETRPDRPECGRITPGSYGAGNLVLHGLWPRGNFCDVTAEQERAAKKFQWDKLPALKLSAALTKDLNEVMPGVDSHLDRYQWIKHGTCSGMPPEEYFRLAATLARQASALRFDDLIAARAGSKLSRAELCRALAADLGSDYARAVKLKISKDGYFQEIQITLQRNAAGTLALTPDHLAGKGKAASCDDSPILIDAPG